MQKVNLYVPLKIARILKKKGFPQVALHFYLTSLKKGYNSKDKLIQTSTAHPQDTAAPNYQQVVDWLRVVHNIVIYIAPAGTYPTNAWQGTICSHNQFTDIKVKFDYYEAFDYLILRVLKEL